MAGRASGLSMTPSCNHRSSRQEGLGSSILDAFIERVPVVATRAGGITETVENMGLLCDIGDSKQIANSINNLLNDKSLKP